MYSQSASGSEQRDTQMPEPITIAIHDESSEKKYFTTVPNYIIDHAGMEAQSLYLIMKKYAGETGSCYASERTLRLKMKAGRMAMKKGLKDLIEGGWIKYKGDQMIDTDGGMQFVKAYVITDIWKRNIDHYTNDKGMSKTTALSKTAGLEPQNMATRGAENERQGMLKTTPNKNQYTNKNQFKENSAKALTPAEIARDFFDRGEPYNRCIEALSKKTSPELVEKEIDKFIEYWTEPNKSGTKVRWEQESTFEIGRRLKTWFNNIRNYSKRETKII